MVNEVNNIIYNTLVAERAIHLPGVGTLSVVRKGAEMSSGSTILPPSYAVEFSSNATATSLVDVIAHEANIDSASAEDIYSRWLEKVRTDTSLTIEGVGRLQQKSFVADKAFVALFNPITAPVKIKRHNKMAISVALVSTFIAVFAIFGVVGWFFFNNTPTPATEVVVEQNTEPAIVTKVEEPIIEEVAEEITPEESVEVVEAIEPEQTVVADDWIQSSDIRHWVIAGSYSTTENAEIAKGALMTKHNDIVCDIFPLGKMYAVAVYGSTDRDDCVEFMRKHSHELENMWIFTPKKYQ